MKLSQLNDSLGYDVVQRIREEFTAFRDSMYAGKSLDERKELDQFFTPPEITIPLLEGLLDSYAEGDKTFANKTILDPTSGTGNLLMACIIAGARPENVFGNDYDAVMVKVCKDRLNAYCEKYGLPLVPKNNIHRGNALQKLCLTEFTETYAQKYRMIYIDDLAYAQGDVNSWDEENNKAKERAMTYYNLFPGF